MDVSTMTDIVEQFAAAWALKQLLDKATKTGVKGNLRDQVNTYYRMLYEADGKKGHDILIGDDKVGRYTFSETKGEAAYTKQKVNIYDFEKVLADDNEDFKEWVAKRINNMMFDLAIQYAEETGDLLDGMAVTTEEIPEVPATISANGKPNSITPEKVAEALGPRLNESMGGMVAGLLASAEQ